MCRSRGIVLNEATQRRISNKHIPRLHMSWRISLVVTRMETLTGWVPIQILVWHIVPLALCPAFVTLEVFEPNQERRSPLSIIAVEYKDRFGLYVLLHEAEGMHVMIGNESLVKLLVFEYEDCVVCDSFNV
jgi:hypothetical protein